MDITVVRNCSLIIIAMIINTLSKCVVVERPWMHVLQCVSNLTNYYSSLFTNTMEPLNKGHVTTKDSFLVPF